MDLPIVITVMDCPERIDYVIGPLREMAPRALITVQELEVVQSGGLFKEGLPDLKVPEVTHREVATQHPDSPITAVNDPRRDHSPRQNAGRECVGALGGKTGQAAAGSEC